MGVNALESCRQTCEICDSKTGSDTYVSNSPSPSPALPSANPGFDRKGGRKNDQNQISWKQSYIMPSKKIHANCSDLHNLFFGQEPGLSEGIVPICSLGQRTPCHCPLEERNGIHPHFSPFFSFFPVDEPSRCYFHDGDGVCEEFEQMTSIVDCGVYTPQGFLDQWASNVSVSHHDERCPGWVVIGQPAANQVRKVLWSHAPSAFHKLGADSFFFMCIPFLKTVALIAEETSDSQPVPLESPTLMFTGVVTVFYAEGENELNFAPICTNQLSTGSSRRRYSVG